MYRMWTALGALAGLTGVAMAAVAAHGLPGRLDAGALDQVRSAVQMQVWHALALLCCGLWAARSGGLLIHLAGAAFASGVVLFCGTVYALALGGMRLPSVAPLGGVLLMLGWALLGVTALVDQH